MLMACLRRLSWAIALVGVHAALPNWASAETGSPSVAKLIEQLDAQENAARETAEQYLIEAGAPAKTALEALLPKKNTEFRTRALRIIQAIDKRETVELRRALDAQIEQFDPDKTTLPGWQRYREAVGDDPSDRDFFFSMLRAEPELLLAYQSSPEKVAKLFDERCLLPIDSRAQKLFPGLATGQMFSGTVLPQNYSKAIGSLAAFLLVAGDEQVKIPEEALLRIEHSYTWQIFTAYELPPQLKKLLTAVILSPTDPSMPKVASWKISRAARQPDDKLTSWLIETALVPQQAPDLRVEALLAIRIAMDNENASVWLEKLASLLDSTSVLKDEKTLLRDVVLAILLQASGLPMKDFDLPDVYLHPLWNRNFENLKLKEDQRKAVLAKWRTWAQNQLQWNKELAAFAKDASDSAKLSLPGWQKFKQLVGDTPQSRALFVQMQRAERELLTKYEADPQAISDLLYEKLKTYPRTLYSPVTYLFLFAAEKVAPTRRASQQLATYLEQYDAAGKQADPQIGPPLRKLLDKYHQAPATQLDDQLNAFAQDPRGLWQLSLPGWKSYCQSLGTKNPSRMFFVEMQRAEPDLFAVYEQGGPELVKQFETCCQYLDQAYPSEHSMQPEGWPSFAAMLLVMNAKESQLPEAAILQGCELTHRFIDSVTGYRGNSFGSVAMNGLISAWISLPVDDKLEKIAYQKMRLSMKYNLSKDLTPFLRVANNRKYQPKHRIQALLGLATRADMRNLEAIIPLVKDETSYKHGGEEFQIRDIALLVLVHLSRQKLQDYGFKVELNKLAQDKFNPAQLFETLNQPEQPVQVTLTKGRDQTLTQWTAWYQPNHQLRNRVEAFVEGKSEDLPGWKRYREIAGDTFKTRKLFAEMQYGDPELLSVLATNPQQLPTLIETRAQQITNPANTPGYQPPSLGAGAAFLFVCGEELVKLPPGQNLKMTEAVRAIGNHHPYKSKKLLRKLALRCLHKPSQVIAGQEDQESNLAAVRLMTAVDHELNDEALFFATRILRAKLDGTAPEAPVGNVMGNWGDMMAMMVIVKYGDESHVELVEPLLDDLSDFAFFQGAKVRDYALAVLIHLTGQNYADYGLHGVVETGEWWFFQIDSIKFKSDRDRDKAIAKWRTWSKANVKQQAKQTRPIQKMAAA